MTAFNYLPIADLATLLGCLCLLKRIICGGSSLRVNVIPSGVRDGLVQCGLSLQTVLSSLSAFLLGLCLLEGVISCAGHFRVCNAQSH